MARLLLDTFILDCFGDPCHCVDRQLIIFPGEYDYKGTGF